MQKQLRLFSMTALPLSLLFSALTSFAHNAPENCNALLQVIPGSYMDYAHKSELRRGSSVLKHPEYLNPQKERELAKLWKGEPAPNLLAPFLPEGVTLISHQLKKASAPGVVKVEQPGGEFLILRVDMPFKGRVVSTNVTVTAQALYQNLARARRGEKTWLIGPDATAALDWGHGGGTKTTGGHTADTLMNYMAKYNVFTVGMDQPFHGGGPREWFENDQDYFEFRVAFRKRFIHPDVPTFMIGHSFGGLIGDMAIRRSGPGHEALGLKEAYAGVIPLSFVADPKPGSSFKEKSMSERALDAERKLADKERRLNAGDLNLFASLMSQDKCSALSGLQCSQISLYNNWTNENLKEKPFFLDQLPSTAQVTTQGFRQPFQDFLNANPADLQNGPIPSLYFMGEHDALYVANEENIETYVRRLKNSILWTVSSRVTFRGEVEKIGHMIFDHYMPKKDHPEALQVMRDYLKSVDLFPPTEDKMVRALFKERVLKGYVEDLTFLTPVNNYDSSFVLMAYQWNPDFTKFLDARIAGLAKAQNKSVRDFRPDYFIEYSDKNVFESYQIIRDFVAAVLKNQGRELVEVPPKQRIQMAKDSNDPMANSREALITFYKTYGNNLAFREFVNELSFIETGATPHFQGLNEIGQALTQRVKALDAIRKEKTSDEEKAAKAAQLGALTNEQGVVLDVDNIEGLAFKLDDSASVKAALERIHLIRNKRFIPEGPRAREAQANVERRGKLQEDIRNLEHQRDDQKKKLKAQRDLLNKKEGQLQELLMAGKSEKLVELEKKRQELHDSLQSYDLKQRDVLESKMIEVIEQNKSWSQAFDQLPPDLQQLFVDTENASATYQAMLKTIESTRLTEALVGHLGADAQALATEIHGENGLLAQVQVLANQVDVTEYIDIAAKREEHDQLLADYVKDIVPDYFTAQRIYLKDVLSQENTSEEQFKELFKSLEKATTMWRSKVLISKPSNEASSLY